MGARGLNRALMLDIGLSGLCTLWSPVMDACKHSSVHDYFLILGGGWRGADPPFGRPRWWVVAMGAGVWFVVTHCLAAEQSRKSSP